jgi:multiple sugar transport system permease protein
MAADTSIWQRLGFRRTYGVAEAGWGRTLVVAGVSLVYFLPVLFIIFTAIKPQALALSVPPTLSPTSLFGLIPDQFVFTPTLENFGSVFSRVMTAGGQPEATGFDRFFFNSIAIALFWIPPLALAIAFAGCWPFTNCIEERFVTVVRQPEKGDTNETE